MLQAQLPRAPLAGTLELNTGPSPFPARPHALMWRAIFRGSNPSTHYLHGKLQRDWQEQSQSFQKERKKDPFKTLYGLEVRNEAPRATNTKVSFLALPSISLSTKEPAKMNGGG